MVVVLPERLDGLESWERSLDGATMARLTTLDKASRVRIFVPRFTLKIASLLVPPLQSLGMRASFGDEANFVGDGWLTQPVHFGDRASGIRGRRRSRHGGRGRHGGRDAPQIGTSGNPTSREFTPTIHFCS